MKLGILAYGTKTGLGYQTYSYYKHLNPHKTLQIDLSPLNGAKQYEWYSDPQRVEGYPQDKDLREFLKGLDTVLMAETPLNYNLYSIARELEVKTVTVHNYEFFDHFAKDLPLPDVLISPSMWHYDDIQSFCDQNNIYHTYLHHPVDREELPFKQRIHREILHVAGKPAAHDRNGTWDFMSAVPDGRVVTQDSDLAERIRKYYSQCDVFTNIEDLRSIYEMGDIMVLPRKYGGNCLPLNEALSTGMPVIMTDITPNNHILPKEWLVPAKRIGEFYPRTRVDLYAVDKHALIEKVQEARNWDMEVESKKADEIAESISWEILKPRFMEILK